MAAFRPKTKTNTSDASLVFTALSTQATGDLVAAKKEWSAKLLRRSQAKIQGARALTAAVGPDPDLNLMGVGIGERLVDDKPTGILTLKFLVRIKYPPDQVLTKYLLPKTVRGIATDVEEVGLLRRFEKKKRRAKAAQAGVMPDPRVRMRPAQPGCSVGFRDPANQFVMAGTFGAVVRGDSNTYILSNNHVLADEGRLAQGSPIFQPGLLDNGNPNTDRIAELTNFVPLAVGMPNRVDAATARVLKTSLVSPAILYIGTPQGTKPAAIDMVVHKFGRTTGYRAGRITSVDTDVSVQYETGTYTFESQIIIRGLDDQPFSDAGDSGSLILERASKQALALLFAGSSTHTIANHIEDVLQALQVTLA